MKLTLEKAHEQRRDEAVPLASSRLSLIKGWITHCSRGFCAQQPNSLRAHKGATKRKAEMPPKLSAADIEVGRDGEPRKAYWQEDVSLKHRISHFTWYCICDFW